jgi:transcriptional repressor NrdR
MHCPFCQSKSRVSNSRSTAKGTQTWRRRACTSCGAIWSTREKIALEDTHCVISSTSSEPFSRDKLFMSIKDSLQHRKTALSDATGLTDTIINDVLLLKSATVPMEKLTAISYTCLRRFDKTASAVYKATYQL